MLFLEMVVSKCEMQEVELMHEELHSSLTEMVPSSPTSSATEENTKPHPNQVVKCPRCDSLNTKFCYYNNYNLTQPRHFCKNCRRYWTKGGSLRNVPVGGGCRKNKRSKQRNTDQPHRCVTATPAVRAGERGGGGGSVENSSTKTVSRGAATTGSGDNSSATYAPTFSSSDGPLSPNTPLPQNVIGCCVTSGYLKFPAHGEEALRPSFDAINTSRNGSPKTSMSQIGSSVTSEFMTSAGDQEELDGEQNFSSSLMDFAVKTSRPQQQNFCSNSLIFNRQESSNLPLFLPANSIPQSDGLPSVDSALLAFNFSTPETPTKRDQNFIENNNNGDLSQVFGTLAHNISNVSPISHTESIGVSGLGADLLNRSNLGFHWRLQNHEHCHYHHHHHHQQQQQQQKQQEQKPSVIPADQFLQSSIDEQTRRRMIEDASAENFGQMREIFSLAGSQILPYEFGNVAFDCQLGSDDFFDPTSDLCYMGGPGVWPDFSPFGAGSATHI